jgi:hypothetical protein
MSFECNATKKALKPSNCALLPEMIVGMITTPLGFSLTEAEALLVDSWQDALFDVAADRIYVWPRFVGVEDQSQEPVYEDTPHALLHVRDGNYRWRFQIKESLCLHRKMYTHRSTTGRAFLIDEAGNIIGTRLANGEIAGFRIQLLNSEKMIINDGSVSTKSPIMLALADNKEFDKNGVMFDGSDFLGSLNPIADALITIVDASDTEINFTVVVECDSTPLPGFVDADFELLDADGAEQTIAVVDNGDGSYTATGTGLESGTLGFSRGPASPLTIEGYEAEPADVTIAS